jgi:hypothetical protein
MVPNSFSEKVVLLKASNNGKIGKYHEKSVKNIVL